MDTAELYRLCGLSDLEKPRTPLPQGKWIPAKLKFIGAENYVLGTKDSEVILKTAKTGFSLMIKGPLVINANLLMGPKHVEGKLYDVEVYVESLKLSLASLRKGEYPKVLRYDETVGLL